MLGTDERISFGPIGASSTPVRFYHFATVFAFTRWRRLSSAIEARDRCIAGATAILTDRRAALEAGVRLLIDKESLGAAAGRNPSADTLSADRACHSAEGKRADVLPVLPPIVLFAIVAGAIAVRRSRETPD